MLYAFTDESYNQRVYLQAALVVDESQLPRLEQLVAKVKERAHRLGVSELAEVHGHSIMHAVHGWEALAGKFNLRLSTYKELLNGLSKISATLLIQGVEIDLLAIRFGPQAIPHLVTFRNLVDQIEIFAATSGQYVEIVSDRISYEVKIRELLVEFRRNSTKGRYHSYLQSIIKIEHVDSHLSAGVQMVDVALFIFNRFNQNQESNSKTRAEVSALWNQLNPLISQEHQPRIWRP